MTRRSGFQQWVLETKAGLMARIAGRLFTFKQTGIDGVLKRAMLRPKGGSARR